MPDILNYAVDHNDTPPMEIRLRRNDDLMQSLMKQYLYYYTTFSFNVAKRQDNYLGKSEKVRN